MNKAIEDKVARDANEAVDSFLNQPSLKEFDEIIKTAMALSGAYYKELQNQPAVCKKCRDSWLHATLTGLSNHTIFVESIIPYIKKKTSKEGLKAWKHSLNVTNFLLGKENEIK